MAREERPWHPNFIQYMRFIASHPNYAGLPIRRGEDGSLGWVAPKKTKIGKARIAWCADKARQMGIPAGPGMYAQVMLAIHPTKRKVCQICGREMSLYYLYPNVNLLKALNRRYGTDFTICDQIGDIWDELVRAGTPREDIARFLIEKGGLDLEPSAPKEAVIGELERRCRAKERACLGPGAMSDFPDRFDGFHPYNRCCRGSQDKGRSKDNLRAYAKDRRAYEYWSDGNIHAANQYMASDRFKNTSADHIGPISLGFVHDPRYLQPMPGGDNSAKRDRLEPKDIEKIIQTERRTGVFPTNWYARELWEHVKASYAAHPERSCEPYRTGMKQNMTDFMFVLRTILDRCPQRGRAFLTEAFLAPNFPCFDYDYTFGSRGEILRRTPRRRTESSRSELDRYCRIAIQAVYEYGEKENRNMAPDLSDREMALLEEICRDVGSPGPAGPIEEKVRSLMRLIQRRLILTM